MDADLSPCPPANRLGALAEGRVEVGEREALEAHLRGCGLCHAIVAGLARAQGRAGPAVRELPTSDAPAAAPQARSLWWVPWVAHAVLTLGVALAAWWFLGRARP